MTRPAGPPAGGFTLLELVLALFIGLLITVTVVQIYQSNRYTAQVTEGLARLQESSRYALYFLYQGIQQAGLPAYEDRSPLVAAYSGDGDGADSDSLGVRFSGRKDCLGQTSAAVVDVQNQFRVAQPAGEPAPALYCGSNLNTDAAGRPLGEPIISGVDHMQVLYGVDSDGDPRRSADRYLSFSLLQSEAAGDPSLWSDVVSIRVALLLNSVEPVKPDDEAQSYQLLDGPRLNFNDRLGRQLITTTVPLRNQL